MKISLALGVIFLLMVLPAAGDLYSWTDANGVKHFSNEPPPVDEGVEQQSEIKYSEEQYNSWREQRQTDQGEMLKGGRSAKNAGGKTAPADGRAGGEPGRVVMYTRPKCKYCIQARAFFKKHAVSFTEYDITADPQALARYKELNGNGVPLIFIGDKRIPGFSERLLKMHLGIR